MIRFPENRSTRKKAILKRTSYRDYLTKLCGLSREAADCLQGRTLDLLWTRGGFGAGLRRARSRLSRLCRLEAAGRHQRAWDEPYIYHFPDGNAAIARLLVRALVPDVALGRTMDDVVEASFDYGKA